MNKVINNGYVVAIGTGIDGADIDELEYNEILTAIKNKPTDTPDGFQYKLRADDLEWELVENPPAPDPGDEDARIEDLENALSEMGVPIA